MSKDKAQIVKVNDLPDNIEPLAMWSRMMQLQHYFMKDKGNRKPIERKALRFEISPTIEESKGWTMQDWLRLAEEFIAVLDSIDYRPKNKDVKLKTPISRTVNMWYRSISIVKVVYHIYI